MTYEKSMSYPQFSYAYPSSHLLTAAAAVAAAGQVSCSSNGCSTLDSCSCQHQGPGGIQGHTSPSHLASATSLSHQQSVASQSQVQPLYTTDTATSTSSSSSSRLLSTYAPRLSSTTPTGLPAAMYTSSYHDQGYMSLATPDPSAFYPPLANTYDLTKDGMSAAAAGGTWGSPAAAAAAAAAYPYDPTAAAVAPMSQYPYSNGYGPVDINGSARRKNATRETTNTLKAWLYEHRKNPYPTKGEKIMLAIITKMTLTQVSTWFANARRRLKKENKMTWSPRNRCGDADDDDDDKDDMIDNASDEKIVCKKEIQDIKDPGQIRDDYESEPEIGNDCRSMTSSRSLSNTPKPSIDPLGQATAHSQLGYHLHNHHPHHGVHHLPHESSDTNLKPKIWSLAQTATSCTPPSAPAPAPHFCRGTSLSPPGPHEQHHGLAYQMPNGGYSSAFNVSKMDRRTPPSPHDSASLLYRGYPSAFKTTAADHQDDNVVVEKQPPIIPNGGIDPWISTHTLPPPPPTAPYYVYNNNNNHLQQEIAPTMESNKPCLNNEIGNATMDKSLNNEEVSNSNLEKSCALSNSSTNHIISTQADTPPQTPPSAQQQQGSLTNNNNNGGGLSMGSYVEPSNAATPYTSSFHGLKNMYEQSTFLGVSHGGFKTENENKNGSLTIR